MPRRLTSTPEPKTIGERIDHLIYERNRSLGQAIDDILYAPGPTAKVVAVTAGAAFGLYAAKVIFNKVIK